MTRKAPMAVIVMGAAAIGLIVITVSAAAATPKITNISPSGVRRGEACEVTVSGEGLAGNPRLIGPVAARVEAVDPKRSGAGSWVFRITVEPDAPVGVYPVRVQTDDGLSNAFLLAVGQFPQVLEKEDNSTFEKAQALPATPLVVEGQAAGNDVDYFRFAGKKGQWLVVDAHCARIGSGVDPTIRLTTASANRRLVGSADDTPGLLTDARLIAQLTEDTDYVLEISDSRYQGAGRAVYRLLIGSVPLAEEVYPLGGREGETVGLELRGTTLGTTRVAATTVRAWPATTLHLPRISGAMASLGSGSADVEAVTARLAGHLPELREPLDPAEAPARGVAPVIFNGRIDPPGDEDRFVLAVTPGQRVRLSVEASRHGSALDGILQVQDAKGTTIANADDTTIQLPNQPAGQGALVYPDPSVDVTVPGGTTELTLVLRDLEGRGGVGFPYRLVATPIVPSFELIANDPEINIPRGGSVAVGVTVKRLDFQDPITVTVQNPPAGLTVRDAIIPTGQSVGTLSLSASPTASFSAIPLRLIGKAKGPSGPIEATATRPLVFAQQSILPTNELVQHGLPAAAAAPTPVTLEVPGEPIELVHGHGATIPLKLARTQGADAALAITPLPLSAGIAVPAANVAEKALTTTVPVNAAVDAPLGQVTIGLAAKGKLAGVEQTVTSPAVILNVVKPAEVELLATAVEIKAGATLEVKGKLKRRGPFKEPVTVRINGLPAGLKAEPVVIAPTAAEFAVKVEADAKAAPATASTAVVSSYQVNKKDYPPTSSPLAVKVLPAK